MTLDPFLRTAGAAGLAAALVGVPADLYHFTIDSRTGAAADNSVFFQLHGIGLVLAFTLSLVALAGLVLAQEGRARRLGAVSAGAALLGTTLVIGNLSSEVFMLPVAPAQLGDPGGYYLVVVIASFAVFAAGWGATAVALRRADVVSRRAAGVLVAGAVLAFPPIPGAYITLLLGIAVVTAPLRRPAAVRAEAPVPVAG